jgi:Na+/melibiose symporter-like transporter
MNNDMALSFFLLLLLGHMIGDFVLQPYWLVLAKRNGWRGLLIHVGVVTFITAILLWISSVPNWWIWIIVLFIGHLFIDQFRTFVFIDNSKGKGLLLLLLDQLAHIVLIAILAWLAAGWTFSDLNLLPTADASNQQRMMAYLIGLAILIGVVPVLEVEMAVAALYVGGVNLNETVRVDLSDRILGSIERIVATFLILIGYGLLVPLIFLPRLALMIYQGQAKENRIPVITKVVVSSVSALVISYLLSLIPPPDLF